MKKSISGAQSESTVAGIVAWLGGLLLILSVHVVWELADRSPPAWDMAYHQLQGWHLLEAARTGSLWNQLPTLSPAYPPLYYLQEALILSLLGDTQFLALLANLPGFLLLTGTTFLFLLPVVQRPLWAGLGANLPLLFPSMAWLSHEALLDIGLTGFVAAAGYCIIWSRGFTRLGPTVVFGFLALGGVLTKWTLPLYLLGPLLFGLLKVAPDRLRGIGNLVLTAVVVVPLSLVYYGPLLSDLAARYPTTNQQGLIPWRPYPRHGEPGLNNIWGWIYYPRVIASYFLQVPLLFFVVAAPWVKGKGTSTESSRQIAELCVWWLVSGTVFLIFLSPKDPRFFLPLICPLAVLLIWGLRESRRWLAGLLGVAFLQFLLVSFGTPWGEVRWASWVWENEADYQSLQHEWVWFQTHYFDAAGPPDSNDWHHDEIVEIIEPGSTVAFLPEKVRFNPDAFLLESVRQEKSLKVLRLGNHPGWQSTLRSVDYLVAKTGDPGISFITPYNRSIRQEIREGWQLIETWLLPDGSRAELWGK